MIPQGLFHEAEKLKDRLADGRSRQARLDDPHPVFKSVLIPPRIELPQECERSPFKPGGLSSLQAPTLAIDHVSNEAFRLMAKLDRFEGLSSDFVDIIQPGSAGVGRRIFAMAEKHLDDRFTHLDGDHVGELTSPVIVKDDVEIFFLKLLHNTILDRICASFPAPAIQFSDSCLSNPKPQAFGRGPTQDQSQPVGHRDANK